ncbi:MAG TPA: hypothetical protein QGH10_20445 [Armatimonadota bacterium]|nr:hypothetical protein [Armatimonadota bacterium]
MAHWDFDNLALPTDTGISQTITVQPKKVTVEDEILGDGIQAVRVSFPMLVYDGAEHASLSFAGNGLALRLQDRSIRFRILSHRGSTIRRTGTSLGHRNGLIEEAYAEVPDSRVVYRISAP